MLPPPRSIGLNHELLHSLSLPSLHRRKQVTIKQWEHNYFELWSLTNIPSRYFHIASTFHFHISPHYFNLHENLSRMHCSNVDHHFSVQSFNFQRNLLFSFSQNIWYYQSHLAPTMFFDLSSYCGNWSFHLNFPFLFLRASYAGPLNEFTSWLTRPYKVVS